LIARLPLLAVFLWAFVAQAVELRDLSIDYDDFHDGSRIAEMPGFKPKEGLAVNVKIDLLGPIYWNNRVHAVTDPGQYRLIGLKFELGVRVFESLDIEYRHHSQHLIDAVGPTKFPVEDSLGVHWTIYQAPVSHPTIF
jgi:hypothetical protein